MVYDICVNDSEDLDDFLDKSIKEFCPFFKITWSYNKPNIFLVRSREVIDKILRKKTPDWWVGWSDGRNIFLLDKKDFENESNHRYSDNDWVLLMRHELVHCFCNVVFPFFQKPSWLREGIAIFLSGQTNAKSKPKKFENFLEYYDQSGNALYRESGFAIECLIKKYGKDKMLTLIKRSQKARSKERFNKIFEKIYGFKANYNNFNKINLG